jgi:hypothetical protein
VFDQLYSYQYYLLLSTKTHTHKMVKKTKNSSLRTSTPVTKAGPSGKRHQQTSQSPATTFVIADPWPDILLSLSVNQYDPQGNRKTSQSSKTCQLTLEVLHPQTVYVARNFLSRAECQAWIDYVDSDTHSRMEYVSHPASRTIAHRECSRWQRNDWTMADRIFQRIQTVSASHSLLAMPQYYSTVILLSV